MTKKNSQKEIFLESEADAWFERNRAVCAERDYSTDPVSSLASELLQPRFEGQSSYSVLEVGCGDGGHLEWLSKNLGANVYGIEPSLKAVKEAVKRGLSVKQGTADALSYEDEKFDLLIFGFCLYLCDPADLFKIAQEADRVLKRHGWLIIKDFYATSPTKRAYHHKKGLFSHKMDFRKLFDWHPHYTCYSHNLSHHSTQQLCDDPNEWVGVSLMRKNYDAE